jgi:predicted ATP-grasp superfamily ATP-dependent carboligase
VELTTDKLALAEHLQRHAIPTPSCLLLEPAPGEPPGSSRRPVTPQTAGINPAARLAAGINPTARRDFPAVWKPRDGAGSQATFLVRNELELAQCRQQARAEGWDGEAILQPFISGRAVSCAVLCGPREHIALPPAEQFLSTDGRFRYLGGSIPLPAPLAERAQQLALRAVRTVPGMRGYVGVDLVLGDAEDGSKDVVIEINPRLTTSYIGLSVLAAGNLMTATLKVASGEPTVLTWRSPVVTFQPDGSVSETSETQPQKPLTH